MIYENIPENDSLKNTEIGVDEIQTKNLKKIKTQLFKAHKTLPVLSAKAKPLSKKKPVEKNSMLTDTRRQETSSKFFVSERLHHNGLVLAKSAQRALYSFIIQGFY